MAAKNFYIVSLLFLIAIVGISNLTYEPRYAPVKQDVVSAENQLKQERQEKIVSTVAASFYFRQ